MSGPIASVDTGEVIASITPDEARHLTDRIRDTVEATWALLLEAHEQRAWAALGYSTWAEYVSAEFSMSRRHSYRLLDHGRVVRAIEEATNSVTRGSHGSVSPIGDISERVARDIKPHLDEVTAEIEERVASEPRPDSGRVREIVSEVIDDHRDELAAAKAARDENVAWIEAMNQKAREVWPDFDPEQDRERGHRVYAVVEAIELILESPAPDSLLGDIEHWNVPAFEGVDQAAMWLSEFARLLKEDPA